MENNIIFIDINEIVPNPHQPRKEFNEERIDELAESIEKVGLIQPLVVRKNSVGYELIAGERRLRASKKIGLKQIPVILFDVNDIGSAAISLIENIQREQLNYIDEAISYKNLIEQHNVTQQQIAKLIGKSQSSVANKLRLLKHSDQVIMKLRSNGLTERHGRALLNLNDEEEKISIINDIINKELNVKDTEKLVEMRHIAIRKKRQKIKSVIKNYKVYLNTIIKAIDEIAKFGVKIHHDITEDEKEYTIVIKIEK
ncbi:MAG: ParB/RepB/Spo0J family partition protein [Bacillota bacterium]|nr:ParB/RepB/Spo0J family partition protein [Bacillota bacterium]